MDLDNEHILWQLIKSFTHHIFRFYAVYHITTCIQTDTALAELYHWGNTILLAQGKKQNIK